MATYRLDIAYEGTEFRGWARQEGQRTVQGELEAALAGLFGGPVPLTVAGRTDAGVHALGQVASFAVEDAAAREPEVVLRALNSMTAPDVAVLDAARADGDFNARRSARSRRYRYRIERGAIPDPFERRYALHYPHRLDRQRLDEAAAVIRGRHDFTAFTPTETEHVHFEREVLDARWLDDGSILQLEIEADAFMRSMVRILVGTMLEIGGGRREPSSLSRLLEGRPRVEAGETAAAHGLFLVGVRYE